MIYKYDGRLKKIFESELIKNILGNLTNIINYNIVIQSRNIKKFIEEKILPKLNITSNILLKLMEGESIYQIFFKCQHILSKILSSIYGKIFIILFSKFY